MEIKVGDKVRVREDAPRIYTQNCLNLSLHNTDFEVTNIDDGCANIQNKDGILTIAYVIPTKYLIKVEDEAKEPKFKKGDRVKFKNIYELQKVKDASFHWMLSMFASKEATITAVEDNGFYRVDIDPSIGGINDDMIESKVEPTTPTIKAGDRVRNIESGLIGVVDNIVYRDVAWVYCMDGNRYNWKFDDLELVQPTEPTGVEENDADNIVDEIGRVVEGYCKSLANLADSFDWQRYEADLAKEVAVKLSKPNENKPDYVAEYAVSVAKAVVENLKKK